MQPSSIRESADVRRTLWPHALSLLIVAFTVIALRAEGGIWWCKCGRLFPWTSDIWSEHCSQHLADPYLFSHISHGFWFYGLLIWIPFKYQRLRFSWVLLVATIVECGWESLENSPLIINRYRAATISIGYTGDSVINSIFDIVACISGVLIARALGFWKTLAVFIVFELTTLIWVKDNLTLNVIMLIYPIESIKQWQSAGHVL